MTHANTHIPVQHSAIYGAIVSVLTTAMIVLAGFLSLAQFAAVG